MEKAVGEVFDFNEIKLRVQDAVQNDSCEECYFDEIEYSCDSSVCGIYAGYCFGPFRSDGKNVIFVEVNNDKED